MKIESIPIIGTLYQWYNEHSARKELEAATQAFSQLSHSSQPALFQPLAARTIDLIDHAKGNRALKREVAKLERTFFTFLQKTGKELPETYVTDENKDLVDKFSRMGISSQFLRYHPDFLSTAREKFWIHYFSLVKIPLMMVNDELYFPVEEEENAGRFTWTSWSKLKELDPDQFRITYQGFAKGHPDHSRFLVPLKTVDSQGKYALQFVTACPIGRRLPSAIDFKDSGHSFTQIIIPQEDKNTAEVFSVGFYPRKVADFGIRFFKTVPGIYRNHDSNVSRIQAGQVIPVVKQYLFHDDRVDDPCLLSILKNMDRISHYFEAQGKKCPIITKKQVEKAMLERNEPELDRLLIQLTDIRKSIAKGKIPICIQPMTRKEKAHIVKRRFEKAQGKHSYHMLGANCTAASFREEAFAVAFLDAVYDKDQAVKVYDSQVDIRDYPFGFFDKLRNILERIFLHFFAALPLTGPILGTGFTHPDTPDADSKSLVPSILSDTASATHALLVAPFVERPLFPAGEILAQQTPVIQPPGFWARLKYLFKRSLLYRGVYRT